MVGIELDRLAVAFDGGRRIALASERIAQIAVRAAIVRLVFERLAVAGDRLVGVAHPVQRDAEVVMRPGEVGLEFKRPAKAFRRAVIFALLLEHPAQIAVHARIVRVQLGGLAERGFGVLPLPAHRAGRPEDVPQGEGRRVGFDQRIGHVDGRAQLATGAQCVQFLDLFRGRVGIGKVCLRRGGVLRR